MKLFIAILSMSLFGCATVSLTAAGSKVRIVKSTPQGCQYLKGVRGEVGSGLFYNDITSEAEDQFEDSIKNRTADLGGNTVEVTDKGRRRWLGEAYICNNNN
jgi:hypothetical protein